MRLATNLLFPSQFQLFSRALALVGLALVLFAAPGPALAQSEEEQAKALFRQGVEASDAGRWAEAADAFTRSLALVERPSTLLNLVTALRQQARYRDALAYGERYLVIAKGPEDAAKRAQVQQLINEMKDAMGTLVLRVEPASAEVKVDGSVVPARSWAQVYVSPGRHDLLISSAGYTTHSETVTVERHVRTQVLVRLKRPGGAVVPPAVTKPAPRAVTPSAERTRLDLKMKLLTLKRDLERAREARSAANRKKPLILAGLGAMAIVAGSLTIAKTDDPSVALVGGGVLVAGSALLIVGGVSGLVRVGKRKHWSSRIDQLEQDIKVTEKQIDFTFELKPGPQAGVGLRLRVPF